MPGRGESGVLSEDGPGIVCMTAEVSGGVILKQGGAEPRPPCALRSDPYRRWRLTPPEPVSTRMRP